MKQGIRRGMIFMAILIIAGVQMAMAQTRGGVKGILKDAQSGEVLMFANVALVGTTMGTVTDNDGNYQLLNVKPGTYTLVFSYLGYKEIKQEIEIRVGETLVVNGVLEVESIMGEEAVVTAMMRGQTAAINKQIKSNTIVNVVSREKISELPDANAAEAIARLPGISIQRDAGEGSKVVVRGLAPKFNSITLNWILKNRYAADHSDPNLAGAVINTRLRHKKGKLWITQRDVGTTFGTRFLASYYDYTFGEKSGK